jgi:hypothetical protein
MSGTSLDVDVREIKAIINLDDSVWLERRRRRRVKVMDISESKGGFPQRDRHQED